MSRDHIVKVGGSFASILKCGEYNVNVDKGLILSAAITNPAAAAVATTGQGSLKHKDQGCPH